MKIDMDSIFGFMVKNDCTGEVASINGKILQGEKASLPSWNISSPCFHLSS
jgi:hypothetical protein